MIVIKWLFFKATPFFWFVPLFICDSIAFMYMFDNDTDEQLYALFNYIHLALMCAGIILAYSVSIYEDISFLNVTLKLTAICLTNPIAHFLSYVHGGKRKYHISAFIMAVQILIIIKIALY